MELAQIQEKFEKAENYIEDDKPADVLQLFSDRLKELDDVIDIVEDLIVLTNEYFKRDNEISDEDLVEIAKAAKTLMNKFENELNSIKKDDNYNFIVNHISPKLIMKLESVIENLDDMHENIDLSLKFQKEFDEIVPLALEYGKKAPTIDVNKKTRKS
ncbi:hypothetical protein MYX76_17905 [Desulfobacterota bacterium AH_259_B03_O07]|nr:hypothetical protein [Desulfobacterota bacterium AH_259_B03_O07]